MSRGRRRKRGSSRGGGGRSLGSTLLGLLILGLAGAGVWYGAQWSEQEGVGILRTLDRNGTDRAEEDLPEVPPGMRVRVEILNAGGVRGMAATARDELRDLGFDVVYYGNASTFDLEGSEVIHRAGEENHARWVADALGIPNLRSDPDSTLLLDVTVRLGSSWESRETREARRPDADG